MSIKSGALYGAIEAGGTKFNCAVGHSPSEVLCRASYPTTTPEETLGQCLAFFKDASSKHGNLSALGIGSFGPLELDPASPRYGSILKTPKVGWSNCKMLDYFIDALAIPVAFDTDVNAAALGEHLFGAAQNVKNLIYVTIGTGIGAGVIAQGRLYQGGAHPEAGHMLMPRNPVIDPFEGSCPYHGDCLEGLAAGPALEKRWGVKGSELADRKEVWDLEAHYLAVMCVNFVNVYGPEKIILGGGVMKQKHLFPLVRDNFAHMMNGYSAMEALTDLDSFIISPLLDGYSGEAGALAMAIELSK